MFSAYHGTDSVFAQAAPRVLYPRHKFQKPLRLFRCIRSHKNGGSLEATSLEWRLLADSHASFVEPDV